MYGKGIAYIDRGGKWCVRQERKREGEKEMGKRGMRGIDTNKMVKGKETSLNLLKCIEHSGKTTLFTDRIRSADIPN